jgi:hypothetical protein
VRGAAASVRPAAVEGALMTVAARKAVQRHVLTKLEALPPRQRGSAGRVLRELAFAAIDDEGHGALRRQEQLAADTGLSTRQVQRVLQELVRLDLLRPHRGAAMQVDRSHCAQCRRARRGMVVYDVIIPATVEVAAGQEVLSFGALTSDTNRPLTGDTVSSVADRHLRRDVVGTDDVVSSLNDSTTRSTANNPSLKGSPSISNALPDRPLFDFRTPGTDRAGARVGAGRSRGRRGSRSSSDVGSSVRVAAPTRCALLGREASDLVSLFELWDPITAQLRSAVVESTWEIWLAKMHPHDLAGDRLVVGAPEQTAMWVNSRFGRLIREWASATLGRPVELEVTSCLGAPALELPRAVA